MSRKPLALLSAVTALLLHALPGHAAGGSGTFSQTINWYGSMTYTVSGAPPSTCGDLYASRNGGAYQRTANWVCTDSGGGAVKGPWTWSSQATDETAYVYIQWPDGTTTNTAKHVWDKTCPTTTITSSNGTPPTAHSGTASDPAWGAGFSSAWSQCITSFLDQTTGRFWNPATAAYDSTSWEPVYCTISGMPSSTVTWSVPSSKIPPSAAHTAGHCYRWTAEVYDGYCSYISTPRSFCM